MKTLKLTKHEYTIICIAVNTVTLLFRSRGYRGQSRLATEEMARVSGILEAFSPDDEMEIKVED